MSLVLPGSDITVPDTSASVTFGPGIGPSSSRADAAVAAGGAASTSRFMATRAGMLVSSAGSSSKGKDRSQSLWVEGVSKRYVPAPRDLVLGTIIARHAEGYRVDLGAAHMSQLNALAFEGATKRSKPNLKVGTLVYAKVSLANRDMEPEIECVDSATGKAEGFGELKGGLMVPCSLQLCRQLLSPKDLLLPILAEHMPFEVAIGLNGRVWFKAGEAGQTIAMARVIEAVDAGKLSVDKASVQAAVKQFL